MDLKPQTRVAPRQIMIEGLKSWCYLEPETRIKQRYRTVEILVLGPTNNSNDEDLETKYDKRISRWGLLSTDLTSRE